MARTSPGSRRIVLDGCYAHYNSGDEAMFACCVQRIKALAPETTLVGLTSRLDVSPYLAALPVTFVSSVSPDWWRENRSGAPGLGRWSERLAWILGRWQAQRAAIPPREGSRGHRLAAHAALIAEADMLWQTGGGFYNDHFARGSASAKLFSIEVARHLGVPLVVSGQGIGPVTLPFTRRLARRALSPAREITLRDRSLSLAELRALGLDGRAAEVGDDAAGLAACAEPRRRALLEAAAVRPGELTAALHVRLATYSTTDPALLAWTAALARKILEETPIRQVLLVPMSVNPRVDEREGYAELLRLAGHPGIRLIEAWMPPDVKGVVSECAVAVGISYHFGVFALSGGVPFVGIHAGPYYRLKSEGLLRMYDQPLRLFGWREPVEPVLSAVRASLDEREALARRARARQTSILAAQDLTDRRWLALAATARHRPAAVTSS